VAWKRYRGRALADATLADAARDAELEDGIRLQNPNLTDIRLERATEATGDADAEAGPRRWYTVTYLAEDGEGD
jgi:hypothetical protein